MGSSKRVGGFQMDLIFEVGWVAVRGWVESRWILSLRWGG